MRDRMKQLKIDGGIANEVGTAYFVVWQLLKLNSVARDDDELLTKMVKTYCRTHGLKIPVFETISRIRRKIQYEEGLYLASAEVQKNRKFRESQFREIFGS